MLFSASYSARGAPRQLVVLAVEGKLQIVVSRFALRELARNLSSKATETAIPLQELLVDIDLEVVPEASAEAITRWRDAGFDTDAPIVAAAIDAQVDYLCTGDGGIHALHELLAEAGLRLIRPRALLNLLQT